MSYIPNYLKDIDKLDAEDKEYMRGYLHAIEDAESNLSNTDMEDEEVREEFETLNGCSAVEMMCAIVEQEKYDSVDFTDSNNIF